jgi:hypothetical protein
MRKEQLALPLAITGVVIVAALATTWAMLAPDRLWQALVGGLTLPLLWGPIELMTKGEKTSTRAAVIAGALIVALFLGFRVAQAAQWIGPDEGKLSLKLFGMAGGLVLAWFGNRIPKMLERFDPTVDVGRRQAFQRMAGWVFTVAGLASALTWLVMPVEAARLWATLIVAGATAFVLARVVQCMVRGRRA